MFRDRRCLRDPFLSDFFRLCHGKALEAPATYSPSEECPDALDFAQVAVELAEKAGDRCTIHRAQGILVHAHIAGCQHAAAAEVLADYRLSAITCCRSCAADWYLRQGDLRVEGHDAYGAGDALRCSLESLGHDAPLDQRAEICFVRGIQHHFQHRPGRALYDAGIALLHLDLTAPQSYFLDTLAFVACFLQFSQDPAHDSQALADLSDFRQRLKGLDGWTAVRTRLVWVEGQIYARVGDWRRAHERLGKAQKDLLAGAAPPRHLLAVGLDRCQLNAERLNDTTRREILRTLNYYKTVLELEPKLKNRLEEVIHAVSSKPRFTQEALLRLRRSFIVPVPGIVVRVTFRRVRRRVSSSASRKGARRGR